MTIINNIIYWNNSDKIQKKQILSRPIFSINKKIKHNVTEILNQVKKKGDNALKKYNLLFDKIQTNELKINKEKINNSKLFLKKNIKNAIQQAYNNIHKFHKSQLLKKKIIKIIPGVFCHQIYRPISKVGLYIPGGTSSLFSTVLMLGIPAKLALCPNIILCSPPPISNEILFSAYLCNIKNIFQIGGAHAIAAMAFGTESINKVNKIFGPGNFFVTEAKRQITNQNEIFYKNVSIDMPAGPSELMILADKSANYNFIIADLLSQAEHGIDSQVFLLTTEEKIAKLVQNKLYKKLEKLPKKKIAIKSLSKSYIIIVKNIKECIKIINKYAPEHLIIQCKNYRQILPKIINAGSIFLGNWSPESAGDYASGTNHVLPTYGHALTYSCLGVYDFQKKMSVQKLTKKGLLNISNTVEIMSKSENLLGHSNAITIRKNFINKNLLNTKKININNIVRKNIFSLKPYQSARLLHNNINNNNTILLNANESPIISLFSLNKKTFNKYPEPQSSKLINLYSKYANLNYKNILVTRGADEGIDIIMRTFCNPVKEKILFCPPTYDMYRVNAEILNIKYIMINSLNNWELNVNFIKKNLYNIKIIFICHPNNPTGNCINKNNIIKLLKLVKNKIIIVIDEAYIEFCINKTLVNLIDKYHNLIILRTLSKAFGLAGLRCGFILTNSKIINILQKVIAPYPIPDPVIDIAIQALYPKNLIIMKNNVKKIIDNKKWLINNLKHYKIIKKIFYSETNFVLIKFFNSHYVFKELYKNKIIVRNQNHENRLKNCLRITIGTFNECKKLIFELKKLSC
ncbi:histidinol dehydrogenase [Enterobacteriaceae endosymbiont of Donacia versicolorea]|uniref:histidinol dehydrogenase n=1 Tax=Enterobacteriaceae endosymbiont of Donacia versicolorea TaxID=2675788 RepID=UPI0014499DB8|nr:histidinol dehydrogenase [Enterobacteriaceae endosymbiont of Donacia versicolorea]